MRLLGCRGVKAGGVAEGWGGALSGTEVAVLSFDPSITCYSGILVFLSECL